MRSLKLALSAIAALAVVAAFTAGTASADVLCTTSGNPCGTKITKGEWSLAGFLAVWEDTGTNSFAECSVGSMSFNIEKQGSGINPSGKISSLTWGAKGAGCNTTVDTVKNGSIEFRTEGTTKAVWASEMEMTLVAFGVTCAYGAGTGSKIGTLSTGAGAKVSGGAVLNRTAGGFLCPETIRWIPVWVWTNHTSVFFVES